MRRTPSPRAASAQILAGRRSRRVRPEAETLAALAREAAIALRRLTVQRVRSWVTPSFAVATGLVYRAVFRRAQHRARIAEEVTGVEHRGYRLQDARLIRFAEQHVA